MYACVYTAHFNNLHTKYGLIQFARKNGITCTNRLVKIHTKYLVALQRDPNENVAPHISRAFFHPTVFRRRTIFSDGFDKCSDAVCLFAIRDVKEEKKTLRK